MDIFSIFFNMKVYCVFSLDSPHRGDSNEYTQYTILNMNKKNTLNYPKCATMGFFQETQERVRNSRGKRAISVRAIEVLLYICTYINYFTIYVHALITLLLHSLYFVTVLFFNYC